MPWLVSSDALPLLLYCSGQIKHVTAHHGVKQHTAMVESNTMSEHAPHTNKKRPPFPRCEDVFVPHRVWRANNTAPATTHYSFGSYSRALYALPQLKITTDAAAYSRHTNRDVSKRPEKRNARPPPPTPSSTPLNNSQAKQNTKHKTRTTTPKAK